MPNPEPPKDDGLLGVDVAASGEAEELSTSGEAERTAAKGEALDENAEKDVCDFFGSGSGMGSSSLRVGFTYGQPKQQEYCRHTEGVSF